MSLPIVKFKIENNQLFINNIEELMVDVEFELDECHYSRKNRVWVNLEDAVADIHCARSPGPGLYYGEMLLRQSKNLYDGKITICSTLNRVKESMMARPVSNHNFYWIKNGVKHVADS